MVRGLALHIGLNSVDAEHYSGWSGDLAGCEGDAEDLAEVARSVGFTGEMLLTAHATRAAVIDRIRNAAKELVAGDVFLLTYSGHGGQLPDRNGDEPDGIDETWCLFDGQLVDDQIYALLGDFVAGVRILALSDSCHSGSVLKEATVRERAKDLPRYRAMPTEIAMRTYRAHRSTYDPILSDRTLIEKQGSVAATGLLISGCQDNQLSQDGPFNGLFTGTLLRVWNNGEFKGSYVTFHKSIAQRMPPDQTPNFFRIGPADRKFEAQRPFTI